MENNNLTLLLNKAVKNQNEKLAERLTHVKKYEYANYTVRINRNSGNDITVKINDLLIEPVEYVPGVGVLKQPTKQIVESFLKEYYNDDSIVVLDEPKLDRLSCCCAELRNVTCEIV
jgi:hypothetical protein